MTRLSTTRATGNRRVATTRSQNLLNVKVRAVTARRQRREKVGGFLWKIIFVLILTVAGWLGLATALDKFFFSNPEYTLHRVNFELDGVMTREDALAETKIREGENIFRVDLAAAEKALSAIPQIEKVSIERNLPGAISVTVVAREPIAWIASPEKDVDPFDPDRAMLVDASGFLMKPRLVRPEFYHLPIIYGVQSDNIRDGEPLHNEDLRRALALLAEVNGSPDGTFRVRSMNIAKGYCIEITTDRNARVTFAPEDFASQLSRLHILLDHCRDTGRELESTNLMVRRNTPATFVMVSSPPKIETPKAGSSAKVRKN